MSETTKPSKMPRAEMIILMLLALIQFMSVLDFIIIMPLGPQFMRVFQITTKEFGYIVSSYTFSASIIGFFCSSLLDRFDRKKALIVLLIGFTIGTLLCSLAPSYIYLVLARILTGAFAGLMGAILFSIIGDIVPMERRGFATGILMSGFGLASVIGVPLGLKLATDFSWNYPFYFLVFWGFLIIPFLYKLLPQMSSHLVSDKKNFFVELKALFSHTNHLRAFFLTMCLTLSGFSVIPFLSPYMVSNVGLTEKDLPFIYLIGGGCTLFSSAISGKLADKYGKKKVFSIMALISTIPIFILTNLGPSSFVVAISYTSFFMIAISGRVIPSMAMITSSVKPQYRGSFMSINSCAQNLASGLAAVNAGNIIVKTASGQIVNYNIVGYIGIFFTFLAILVARKLEYES